MSNFYAEQAFQSAPFVKLLVEKMPPIMFIALCRASPIFYRKCKNQLNETAQSVVHRAVEQAVHLLAKNGCDCEYPEEREKHVKTSYAEFMQGLRDNYHWLTGSLLLDILQGNAGDENIMLDEERDIDILTYHHVRGERGFSDRLLCAPLYKDRLGPVVDEYENEDEFYGDSSRLIREVCSDAWGKKLYQFIVIEQGMVHDHLDTYDMSFCANAYGHGGQLIIKDVNAIIKRECSVSLIGTYFLRRKDRRPFMVYRMFKNAKTRIEKYYKRGYFVKIQDASGSFHLTVLGYDMFPIPPVMFRPKELKEVSQQDRDAIDLWLDLWSDVLARPNYVYQKRIVYRVLKGFDINNND